MRQLLYNVDCEGQKAQERLRESTECAEVTALDNVSSSLHAGCLTCLTNLSIWATRHRDILCRRMHWETIGKQLHR
jgi:hypothetical protein